MQFTPRTGMNPLEYPGSDPKMAPSETRPERDGMKLLRTAAPLMLGLVYLLSAGATAAAERDELTGAARGEALAWQHRCMTCHGVTGMSSDERYPHLAAQKEAYIVDRLKYFKSEQEPFNQMNGQARPLSEADMQDLAAYYAAQRR